MEQAKLVGASAVRERCGNISDMTLWRWVNDPALGFPAPIRIQRRRYWREADLTAWFERQAAKAEA